MQRHFGHNQLRNCYPAFTEQFDLLLESDVNWEPYSEDHRDGAYPGGISNMCTRDWAYWMTKAKIIFDIFVEEMSQQRVMRQFGQRQLIEPPPPTVPLPPRVHTSVQFNFILSYYINWTIIDGLVQFNFQVQQKRSEQDCCWMGTAPGSIHHGLGHCAGSFMGH